MRRNGMKRAWTGLALAGLMVMTLGIQAYRAAGCVTETGTPPPWGKTEPNQYMVDKINFAYKIAKLNGFETPTVPPIVGKHPLLIILVEDATDGAAFKAAYKTNSLWNTRIKQIAAYYTEVSRGMLNVVPATESWGTANDGVIGPVRCPSLNASSDIAGANSPTIFTEAIRAANPYINYAAYDKNGDGKITSDELHVQIYQAGREKAYQNVYPTAPMGWGHNKYSASGFTGAVPPLDSDGKILTSYCYCGSEFSTGEMATQGVGTHELGHDLGLPDLYDTNGATGGQSAGLGRFCLMSSGNWATDGGLSGDKPTHIDAYYKAWLGWAAPMIASPTTNNTYLLPAANGSNAFIRVNIPGSLQFFIIENRQQTGFDAGLPYTLGGLLILHCDGAILNGTGAINATSTNLGMAVEEADGSTALLTNATQGKDTDLFRKGNKVDFTNTTLPSTKLKNGTPTGLSVTGITASGPSMMLNLGTVLPVINQFSINYGATTTKDRLVTLYNTIAGNVTPTYYMASESSSFTGAAWQPYSTVPKFTLSAGGTWHTVYLKVKDSYGHISGTRTDAIILDEIVPLTVGTAWTSAEIKPAGELDWFSFVVPTANYYAIETQAGTLTDNYLRLYGPGNQTTLITQDDNSGPGNMARIVRYLAPGTYYLRSQGLTSQYLGSYTIRVSVLPRPVVTSFTINNNDLFTAKRPVVLNCTVTGTVTDYMASESASFTGAVWKPWTTANILYSLVSAGDGVKAVYLIVRNEAGISAVVSDRIELRSLAIRALLIYKSVSTNVSVYASILRSRGFDPTVIRRDDLGRYDLSKYHVIILSEESGDWPGWGTQAQIDKIKASLKPVIGLGLGGYLYFGKLALTIGYPNGWANTEGSIWVVDGGHTVFSAPNNLAVGNGATLPLFSQASSDQAIYLPAVQRGIVPLGRETGDRTHYSIIEQGNNFLWGFNSDARLLTAQGANLFENVVRYAAGLGTW